MPATSSRTLFSFLSPGRVRVDLNAEGKQELIEKMVAIVSETDPSIRPDQLLEDVLEREALMSTGVGEGLALPHARTSAVQETVAAFATLSSLIDYDALDGQPVQIVLLLAGPEGDRGEHVRLLGRISRLMSRKGVREALLEAATADEVLDIVKSQEDAIS